MKCDICGKRILMDEKRPDGLPAGVGFELEDGRLINICTECIMAPDIIKRVAKLKEDTND